MRAHGGLGSGIMSAMTVIGGSAAARRIRPRLWVAIVLAAGILICLPWVVAVAGGVTGGHPGGDPGGDGGGDCTPWVESALDDINGHLSRYDVYPPGYGVADATYVELLDAYGVSGPFALYLGSDGDWYLDPDRVPGSGDCP